MRFPGVANLKTFVPSFFAYFDPPGHSKSEGLQSSRCDHRFPDDVAVLMVQASSRSACKIVFVDVFLAKFDPPGNGKSVVLQSPRCDHRFPDDAAMPMVPVTSL